MVCQKEKNFLMKKGEDFSQHIQHDHGFWKYSDYLAYLTGKDRVEQNGFENIVWENYNNKKVNWIPSKDMEESVPDLEAEEQKKKIEEAEAKFKTDVNEKLEKITANLQKVLDTMPKEVPPQAPPA
jgi:hypothetical protein